MLGDMSETVHQVMVHGRPMKVSVRAGEGVPLLICNGLGAALELFDPFVDRLDPRIPVVRFDAPGIGGSRLPRRPYTFASLARSLGDVLRELGFDEFDVLGISWGGSLAQEVAIEHPRRCRRVVLVSSSAGWTMVPGRPEAYAAMVAPKPLRKRWPRGSAAGALFGGAVRDDPSIAALYSSKAQPVTSRGYLLQLAAGAGWTSLPRLPSLAQPVLLLSGDDDPITPLANAWLMHSALPDAEVHVFHDGHLGLLTCLDELVPRIEGFVRA